MRRLWCALVAALCLWCGIAGAAAPSIRFQVGNGLFYVPVQVAADQGYFDQAAKRVGLDGLTVQLVPVATGSGVVDALLSGSVDIGMQGSTTFLVTPTLYSQSPGVLPSAFSEPSIMTEVKPA